MSQQAVVLSSKARFGLLMATLLALHPVFIWMARRAVDGSDEPWGFVALVGAVAVVVRRREKPGYRVSLWAPMLALMAYATSLWCFTPLPRALLAVTALSLLTSRLYLRRSLDLGLLSLMWLSLPWMASLQFYLGYPLRVLVAELSTGLLRMGGYPITVEGVALAVGDQLVIVDAPCSGVKMLWAGGLVVSLLVAWFRLGVWRSLAAFATTAALLIVANVLRASALFYVELGLVELPSDGHTWVGLVVFLSAALGIASTVRWLERVKPCAQ